MSIANYSFLPWLRRGISNNLTTPVSQLRASVDVTLTVNGHTVSNSVELIGPGDITGINSNAIVRTDPKNWITDFEPNYFPFIEFYDEDFPWRYTPETPDASHRLRPWLHLLVLEEDEFERNSSASQPLTSIRLSQDTIVSVFPDAEQTWAWAHVHINSSVTKTGSTPDNSALDTLISDNPDIAVSRLFSARKLEANTAYYAFLVPAFESGRYAGLGQDIPEGTSAGTASWPHDDEAKNEYPVYYEWFFRTGNNGDFEYLVGLLEPRTMDPSIGIRDMDVHQPQFGLDDLGPNAIVGLEGALKAPDSVSRYFTDAGDSSSFETGVQEIINLQDDLSSAGAETTPLVSPPFYGQWHALVSRLNIDPANGNWINDLNKDPRNRTAAGMGALVVQKKQESYVKTAWEQVGDILKANQKIRFAQLAAGAAERIYAKHIVALEADSCLLITKPVHAKVLGSPTTIYKQVQESIVPEAAFSRSFRKMVRNGGNLMQTLKGAAGSWPSTGIITQLNNGSITAATPKSTPQGIVTNEEIAAATTHNKIAAWIAAHPWLYAIIALMILVLLFLFTQNWTWVLLAAVGLTMLYFAALKTSKRTAIVESTTTGGLTSTHVRSIIPAPSFTITEPRSTTGPTVPVDPVVSAAETARFRDALLDFAGVLEQPVPQPAVRPALDLRNALLKLKAAINPKTALAKRILPHIRIGERVPETFTPVMAYPDIKQPMYEPLSAISSEFLIPNLNLIPQNTISLLETNQPFIEAFMTGLNHEMARELLWREYPTDQRGSYFRQFWDVSRYVNTEGLPEEELSEKLKDITPIHTWSSRSNLGDHNNRVTGSDASQLVLVIRGDVLKKYPNTVIYAQKARWKTDEAELELDDSGGGGLDDPNIMYPAFGAAVNPDISFIGFDLSIEEAKGEVTEETEAEKTRLGSANLGWYFILKEIPGEPRFGLDTAGRTATTATSWDDLSWAHIYESGSISNGCIDLDQSIRANVTGTDIQWNNNSADMAYILYQKPVMIAVHAKDML
jgi:hypothetical protein